MEEYDKQEIQKLIERAAKKESPAWLVVIEKFIIVPLLLLVVTVLLVGSKAVNVEKFN